VTMRQRSTGRAVLDWTGAVVSVVAMLALVLSWEGAIDLPGRWSTIVTAVAIGSFVLFWVTAFVRRRAERGEELDALGIPVRLTEPARRAIGQRSGAVWVWSERGVVRASTTGPAKGIVFGRARPAGEVDVYLEEGLGAAGETITVASTEDGNVRAWRPGSVERVIVKPLARRLIRRRGNRVWVWHGEDGLTKTGFHPPAPDEPFEQVVLDDGQEVFLSQRVLWRRDHSLVLEFWPLPPSVVAVTNESNLG
jgi:hypothetical protein